MVPICLDAVSTARLFVKLILMKIIKIAATSCNISKLKCTEFHFRHRPHWGGGEEGGEAEGKCCIVAVGGWTLLDGFIYIFALTPSSRLLTLFQSCDFV